MKTPLPILTAAAVTVLAVAAFWPAMEVGFLSDDFHFIGRIAELAEASPGLGDQLVEGVTAFGRWHENFHAFRPLTIATLQLDYALHRVDARGFRATNFVLWIACAWLFSAVCKAYLGVASMRGRAATFLLFAWWPLAIEPLAWAMIRQDSLLVAAALAGALILKRARTRPWLVTAPLLVALAAKETSIVLPLAFAAIDAALLRRELVPSRRLAGVLMRRTWPWFLAVAVWWCARHALGAEAVWFGQSAAAVVFSQDTPARLLRGLLNGLRALVLPVNLGRDGLALPAILAGVAGAIGIVACVLALRRARGADIAAGLVWFFAPTLLIVPFYSVGLALDAARSMLLPGLAWLFATVAGAAIAARQRPRLVAVASIVLLAADVIVLRFNLGAFVDASARVDRVFADVRDWPAGKAYLLRARSGNALMPVLRGYQGVWLFGSLDDPLSAPFMTGGLDLVLLAREDEPRLSERVADPARRGLIAAVVADRDGPRLRRLGGPASGPSIALVPDNGATIAGRRPPVLAVTVPAGIAEVGDVCAIAVSDPAGNVVEAKKSLATDDLRAGPTRIVFGPRDFGLPASAAPLASVESSMIIWSATLSRGSDLIARSSYAAVHVSDDG